MQFFRPKPSRQPHSFFSLHRQTIPANPVSSIFKIYPQSNHFFPPPLPSTLIQAPFNSNQDYCKSKSLLIGPLAYALMPLRSLLQKATRVKLLESKSDHVPLLLKTLSEQNPKSLLQSTRPFIIQLRAHFRSHHLPFSLLLIPIQGYLHPHYSSLIIPIMPYFCLKISVLAIFTALNFFISQILAEHSLISFKSAQKSSP